MNEIRNKLIKMIPRSMRILTRKVTLRDVTEYETYFSINLILKRFYHINLKEKINVILISSEHTEVLDFALEKNILSIKLTPDILLQLESNSSINLTVEEKHMIIEQQENIQEKNSIVKVGEYNNVSTNILIQLYLFILVTTIN